MCCSANNGPLPAAPVARMAPVAQMAPMVSAPALNMLADVTLAQAAIEGLYKAAPVNRSRAEANSAAYSTRIYAEEEGRPYHRWNTRA